MSNSSSKIIQSLKEPFRKAFTGSRNESSASALLGFDDSEGLKDDGDAIRNKPVDKLDTRTLHLLVTFLNERSSRQLYSAEWSRTEADKIILLPSVWRLGQLRRKGMWYRSVQPSKSPNNLGQIFAPHPDSHVMLRNGASIEPYSIQEIFAHEHPLSPGVAPSMEIFLVVRKYVELHPEDIKFDYWRKYSIAGGKLYYDRLDNSPKLAGPNDIVCHFAKTPFEVEEFPGIQGLPMHVLPLNWVCLCSPISDY